MKPWWNCHPSKSEYLETMEWKHKEWGCLTWSMRKAFRSPEGSSEHNSTASWFLLSAAQGPLCISMPLSHHHLTLWWDELPRQTGWKLLPIPCRDVSCRWSSLKVHTMGPGMHQHLPIQGLGAWRWEHGGEGGGGTAASPSNTDGCFTHSEQKHKAGAVSPPNVMSCLHYIRK